MQKRVVNRDLEFKKGTVCSSMREGRRLNSLGSQTFIHINLAKVKGIPSS
jgi:hypothetical protein